MRGHKTAGNGSQILQWKRKAEVQVQGAGKAGDGMSSERTHGSCLHSTL